MRDAHARELPRHEQSPTAATRLQVKLFRAMQSAQM